MPFGGGTQTQLTHEGGTDAMPTSDGATVLYYRDGEVRRIASNGGPESTVAKGVRRGKWTLGDKVYVVRTRDDRSVVFEIGADGQNKKVVYEAPFHLEDTSTVSAIGISARTGDIFLQQQARLESDLIIVKNFR